MRSRMSAVWSAARTRAMSTGSFACSSSASARLRASAARASSISSECSARSAITTTLSGRTSTNPPLMSSDCSVPPFLIRSSPVPRAVMRRVWCGRMPSWPSIPGTMTMSTSSVNARRSGLTISSWSGIGLAHALRVLGHVLDRAGEVEGLLRQRVVLALEDLPEAADGLRQGRVLAGPAGELLGHEHRLAHEALEPPSPRHGDLVVLAELIHAEDGDDVLEILVALERSLDLARHVEVLLPDDPWVEDGGGRRERVDRRVDAELHDRALEPNRRVEMTERRGRRRVGVVVRRDEDRLEARDRA